MASDAAGDARVGRTLGHYRVLQKIGAGGMGEVYRARDERLERDVAIKVLPPGTLTDETARRRFHREAIALSKLNHPSIATIHDFDTQERVDFLVMEFIPGTTLSDRLAGRQLSEAEVISLGLQLAEGLFSAHEQGVVHRDLKPGNLRLTHDGRLKILDFGLAKLRSTAADESAAETASDIDPMAGTLSYMAPEQLLGGEIDARTDVHAAGAVLYEMVTGERPFADVERSQLIGAIIRRTPRPPSALNPAVSPELERIIGKCLEKEPENRFQSARELAIDLRRLERHGDSSASRDSERSVRPMLPPRRARWRTWALAGGALLVLAVGAGSAWYKYGRRHAAPSAAPSIAVLAFADLSAAHDQEYFSDGLAEEILNDLAKIPNLKVVARSSAFQFKGKNEDLRDIARKLNVEHVLEGSVRKVGNQVRITAQLVKASDGFHVWSESYDRDVENVLTVQDEIAKSVTSALEVKLLAGATRPAAPMWPAAPAAYQEVLRARYFARTVDRTSTDKALEHVNLAIEADPRYAAAYALRASLTLTSGSLTWMDYSEAVRRARRDTDKAIALRPDLAEGYRVLSQLQSVVDSNCRAAETTLKRARELAPGDADNIGQSGFVATCLGHQEEAVELLRRALALDPLQPVRFLRLAQNLRDLGRLDEAHEALGKALDLNPNSVWVHETRGEVYLAQGRAPEALEEMKKEPEGFFHDLGLALAYHALGRRRESDASLANMVAACATGCAYQIAEAHAYRGERNEAFAWLDRAYRQHDGGLMLFQTDLLLQGLRADPRYAEMLRRLGLADPGH